MNDINQQISDFINKKYENLEREKEMDEINKLSARIDKLTDKLDECIRQVEKNNNDLEWVKTFIKISISGTGAVVMAMIMIVFKVWGS